MEKLLARLLETELLTEDTKKELEAAINEQLEIARDTARSEVEKEVRASLAEQWVTERNSIIESLDAKVDDFLVAEVTELRKDISRFRDLEAEHAEKLIEARSELAEQAQKDVHDLTKKLAAFLELRLAAEIDELKEDIQEVKKLQFGKKLFEAFSNEFHKSFNDEEGTMTALRTAETRLQEAHTKLEVQTKKLNEAERSNKMRDVLAPLSGRPRETMAAILKTIPTNELQEGYNTFISRVLRENAAVDTQVATRSEKEESKVLAEQVKEPAKAVLKTGDVVTASNVVDSKVTAASKVLSESEKHMRRLAGLE